MVHTLVNKGAPSISCVRIRLKAASTAVRRSAPNPGPWPSYTALRSQYRQPQPDGGQSKSLRFVTQTPEHFIPGDAIGAVPVDFIQPPVQFLALRLGKWNRLRCLIQAFPDLVEKLQTLLDCKGADVNRSHTLYFT